MTTPKTMKTFSGLFLVMLLAFSTSGCGTVVGRGSSSYYVDATYYKGIQGTYQFLTFDATSGYDPTDLMCWISIICPVAFVYSLPVDFAIDTVLLPYDFYKS